MYRRDTEKFTKLGTGFFATSRHDDGEFTDFTKTASSGTGSARDWMSGRNGGDGGGGGSGPAGGGEQQKKGWGEEGLGPDVGLGTPIITAAHTFYEATDSADGMRRGGDLQYPSKNVVILVGLSSAPDREPTRWKLKAEIVCSPWAAPGQVGHMKRWGRESHGHEHAPHRPQANRHDPEAAPDVCILRITGIVKTFASPAPDNMPGLTEAWRKIYMPELDKEFEDDVVPFHHMHVYRKQNNFFSFERVAPELTKRRSFVLTGESVPLLEQCTVGGYD